MSLPADLQRFAPIAVAAVLAIAGLIFVSHGIGGGSKGGAQSADQVIARAFSATQQGHAGKITGSVSVNVSGPEAAAANLSRPFSMSIDGFANDSTAAQPRSFDIGVKVEGGGERHTVRVISTSKRRFIEMDGRAYELPAAQVKRLGSGGAAGQESPALKTLGIDPRTWVKGATDAGTARVGGEDTTHVSADIDVPRMFSDLMTAAERSGQAQQIPAEARAQIGKAVKDAKLEIFASKRDGSLRRVAATAHFEAPGPQGKPLQGDLTFDLQATPLPEAQRVVAPRHAAPFSDLAQSPLGLRGLS